MRGRDYIKLESRWRSCKRVFAEASETPTVLGIGEWVRKPKPGRRAKTASGKRARSKRRLHACPRCRAFFEYGQIGGGFPWK